MQDSMLYLIIIGAGVVVIAAVSAIVNNVISSVRGFQKIRTAENPPRNPPLPEEVAKEYATKREIAELKQEIKDERKRVDTILNQQFELIRKMSDENAKSYNSLKSSIGEWQLGIERLIGKIEGKVESK